MTHDELTSALAAVRDAGDDDPGELVEATRGRVVRSLEVRVRRHRQLVSFATIMVVLLGGTVSWAWTTGRLQALWSSPPPPVPTEERAPEIAPPPIPKRAAAAPVQREEVAAPAVELEHELPPPPPPPAPRVVPKPPAPTPVEALYRKAHELHFRGRDPVAALAAWDAYLAAEPTGRFAVEARFNRGIVFARLGRYTDALTALEPFANGSVEPAGYRQDEAAQLVERLQKLVANPMNDR